jgi:C_GCAxxG_C_C family probable redox protein
MADEMNRVVELGRRGFYCSQILLSLGLEAQGKRNPDLVRAMAGLAGGLGFTGGTCGALTGGACLLGLYAGKGTDEEEEDGRLNIMIGELVEWFSGEYAPLYGGTSCEVILTDGSRNRITRCPGIVAAVYERVGAILESYGFHPEEGD